MSLSMEISYARWKDYADGKVPDLEEGIQVHMYNGSRYHVEIKKYPLTNDGFEMFRKDVLRVKGPEPLKGRDITFNRVGDSTKEKVRNGLSPIVRW